MHFPRPRDHALELEAKHRLEWHASPERKQLADTLKTFKRGDLVIAAGIRGVVSAVDTKTLTVFVSFGKQPVGYSVASVTHA